MTSLRPSSSKLQCPTFVVVIHFAMCRTQCSAIAHYVNHIVLVLLKPRIRKFKCPAILGDDPDKLLRSTFRKMSGNFQRNGDISTKLSNKVSNDLFSNATNVTPCPSWVKLHRTKITFEYWFFLLRFRSRYILLLPAGEVFVLGSVRIINRNRWLVLALLFACDAVPQAQIAFPQLQVSPKEHYFQE